MRDVKRIKPFLEKLGKIWETEVPDWRFGQLVSNLQRQYGDLFYLEEDDFLEQMEKFFKAINEYAKKQKGEER